MADTGLDAGGNGYDPNHDAKLTEDFVSKRLACRLPGYPSGGGGSDPFSIVAA